MSRLPGALVTRVRVPRGRSAACRRGCRLRSTTWTVTGTDRLHTVAREYTGTKFKKTISNEKDRFAVTITFDAGGSATAGTFSITEYEAFPVIGTWSSTKENKVILTVNQAQLPADLVAEVCPASTSPLKD